MTTNAIAIARELVNKGGADEKLANAIAEVVVTHSDANSASKADLARVEAEAKADRQARAEKESDAKEDSAEIKSEINQVKVALNKLGDRMTRMETKMGILMWMLGALIGLNIAMFVFLLNTPTA